MRLTLCFKVVLFFIFMCFCTFKTMANSVEQREHRVVIIHLFLLKQALANFNQDVGRFPSTSEGLVALVHQPRNSHGWKGPYMKLEKLDEWGKTDVWGTKYIYLSPAKYGNLPYDLYSCGKNQTDEFGQGDDITNWKEIDFNYYDDSKPEPEKKVIIMVSMLLLILIVVLFHYFWPL